MHSNEAVDIENKNIRHFQNARIRIYYARSSLLENNNKQIHQKCDPIFRLEQFVEHPLHIGARYATRNSQDLACEKFDLFIGLT